MCPTFAKLFLGLPGSSCGSPTAIFSFRVSDFLHVCSRWFTRMHEARILIETLLLANDRMLTGINSWVPLPRSCVDGNRYVSLQVVAQRMKSVGNIQKITAAMKMVAASRLKGAQMKMEKSRGLVQPLTSAAGRRPG